MAAPRRAIVQNAPGAANRTLTDVEHVGCFRLRDRRRLANIFQFRSGFEVGALGFRANEIIRRFEIEETIIKRQICRLIRLPISAPTTIRQLRRDDRPLRLVQMTTDANGIASDMTGALERHTFATQANFGLR